MSPVRSRPWPPNLRLGKDGVANSPESVNREVVGAYIFYPADAAKTDIVLAYIDDSLIREQNIGAFAFLLEFTHFLSAEVRLTPTNKG